MSDKLPKVSLCKSECGQYIYFDPHSIISHPDANRWYPLVYDNVNHAYTGQAHDCPNYKRREGQPPTATIPEQPKPIPASGPETWEQKIGLLNGQIFMRMDKFDQDFNKVMKEFTAALDRTEARLNQIVAALDEMKEDNL